MSGIIGLSQETLRLRASETRQPLSVIRNNKQQLQGSQGWQTPIPEVNYTSQKSQHLPKSQEPTSATPALVQESQELSSVIDDIKQEVLDSQKPLKFLNRVSAIPQIKQEWPEGQGPFSALLGVVRESEEPTSATPGAVQSSRELNSAIGDIKQEVLESQKPLRPQNLVSTIPQIKQEWSEGQEPNSGVPDDMQEPQEDPPSLQPPVPVAAPIQQLSLEFQQGMDTSDVQSSADYYLKMKHPNSKVFEYIKMSGRGNNLYKVKDMFLPALRANVPRAIETIKLRYRQPRWTKKPRQEYKKLNFDMLQLSAIQHLLFHSGIFINSALLEAFPLVKPDLHGDFVRLRTLATSWHKAQEEKFMGRIILWGSQHSHPEIVRNCIKWYENHASVTDGGMEELKKYWSEYLFRELYPEIGLHVDYFSCFEDESKLPYQYITSVFCNMAPIAVYINLFKEGMPQYNELKAELRKRYRECVLLDKWRGLEISDLVMCTLEDMKYMSGKKFKRRKLNTPE